jgi:glycosyltransferase involved in cell wall biosynthesis
MRVDNKNITIPHICILTSVHSHTDVRIYLKEARSLAGAGYRITLISPDGVGQDELGICFKKIKPIESRLLRIIFSPFSMIKIALSEKASVYHFHDPELVFIGLILKLFGKKVIYDVHEDVPRQILNKPWIKPILRKLIAFIFEAFENFSSRRYDRIITATPVIDERFKKQKCRTININNYPIMNEFIPTTAKWEERDNSVCYIGGITRVRGIVELIKASGKSQARLELAGKFESEEIKAEIYSMDEWQKVDYYGFIGRERIVEILSKVKAGVVTIHPIPNYLESLPIKMFEYMAAGIPVIASKFPYWQKIYAEGECGLFVDPLSPEQIANAIDWILNNPQEAEQMGKRGRDLVSQKYNWGAEEKKLLKLYGEVLENEVK